MVCVEKRLDLTIGVDDLKFGAELHTLICLSSAPMGQFRSIW